MHSSSPPKARALSRALRVLANPAQATLLKSFFKTGPGQYGEGDRFLGLKVPQIRNLVRQFSQMPPLEARKLVRSPWHEERLAGLLLWVAAFQKGNPQMRQQVFRLYLQNTACINNWDLVDLSAPHIVGGSTAPGNTRLLESLAESPLLWERRIAILGTFAFIRQGHVSPTLRLCERLMRDTQDLMHKACGWMLREVGKQDRRTLSAFLDHHHRTMPRTMLRYALEHYPEAQRRRYMKRDQ